MTWLLRRLGLYLVQIWVTLTINFFLPRLMPGNPLELIIGNLKGRVTVQEIDAIKAQFGVGLNQPWLVQYWHYIVLLFHGNLGVSITKTQSVSSVIGASVWWTVGLIGVATIVSFVLGTFLGVILGWTRGSRFDALIPIGTFLQSAPFYFLGTILVMVFAVHYHWFPIIGADDPTLQQGWNWPFISSVLTHAELPILSIVLSSLAGWMLGMRNMMVTMIGEDFVLMAVAKGLPRRRVIWHAARNAILPSIANFALSIGFLVAGSLLVEQVFNYLGVGALLLNAVGNLDYPLLTGILLLITITVAAANFLADILYYALDPRTRTAATH